MKGLIIANADNIKKEGEGKPVNDFEKRKEAAVALTFFEKIFRRAWAGLEVRILCVCFICSVLVRFEKCRSIVQEASTLG